MSELQVIERRLRDLVNVVRKVYPLLANKAKWNKICAAMDVVGDTELAILEYENLKISKMSGGFCYLVVYGILQILFVQQDATRHIAEVLGLNIDFPSELFEIREMRNAFIGHPTELRRKGQISQGFISRTTIGLSGFQYLRTSTIGEDTWGYVNISELINVQRSHVNKLMESFVAHLEKEELEHRRQYRAKKLTGAFPETLGYGFEKMGEGIRNSTVRAHIGKWGLEQTIDAVNVFKNMLVERGIYGAYEYPLKELEYPFNQMLVYYDGQPTHLCDEDAEIFRFYITTKVKYLIDIAAKIDKDYESDKID